jgi:hypothetical protein
MRASGHERRSGARPGERRHVSPGISEYAAWAAPRPTSVSVRTKTLNSELPQLADIVSRLL